MTTKEQLRSNQKTLALSTLRSKKSLEDLLSKRLATLHQLQTVLQSINNAQNDVEVLKAYGSATHTLKNVLSNPSLEIGHVEQTMEDMAEALAGQAEIDDAIQTGGRVAVGNTVDEDELEKELADLVLDEKQRQRAQEEEKREKAERLAQLEPRPLPPSSVPTATPAATPAAKDDDTWQKTFEDAQQRQADEAKRAEMERLQREEKRVAAE